MGRPMWWHPGLVLPCALMLPVIVPARAARVVRLKKIVKNNNPHDRLKFKCDLRAEKIFLVA